MARLVLGGVAGYLQNKTRKAENGPPMELLKTTWYTPICDKVRRLRKKGMSLQYIKSNEYTKV